MEYIRQHIRIKNSRNEPIEAIVFDSSAQYLTYISYRFIVNYNHHMIARGDISVHTNGKKFIYINPEKGHGSDMNFTGLKEKILEIFERKELDDIVERTDHELRECLSV